MRARSVFIKLFITITATIIFSVIIIVGLVFNWANNTEVDMVGKTHVEFIVLPGQVVDYKGFIVLNESTKQLEQIDKDIRNMIADYMKVNNLKLKEGPHYFNRVDGTYDEYINKDFKFEKNIRE